MLSRLHVFVFIIGIAAVFCTPGWAAGERGWFGFAVSVDAEALSFNPTLRSVKIEKVVPSSPAALAGLAANDDVLEVQGILVAGAKADVLMAAMQKSVGEILTLKIKRDAAETHEVSLTSAPKPVEQ
jgi:C-terminal processing protease CtpA/Prc